MKMINMHIFDARGNGDGNTSPTITGDHQNRITDYTAIVLEIYETVCRNDSRPSDTKDD